MKITDCIIELLHTHKDVIVPGLGRFTGTVRPARYIPETGLFLPAGKDIVFDPSVSEDDGLLVHYLILTEKILPEEAREKIDSFSATVRQGLESGKKVRLTGIGILTRDMNGGYELAVQGNSAFYDASFGLSPFKPARDKKSKPRTERVGEDAPAGSRRKNATMAWLISILVVFCALAYWGIREKRLLFNEYAQIYEKVQSYRKSARKWKPFSQENVLKQTSSVPQHFQGEVHKLSYYVPGSRPAGSAGDTVASLIVPLNPGYKPDAEVKPAVKDSLPATAEKMYYIVAGSFVMEEKAQRLVKQLIEKGYNAKIFGKNPKGHFMVCYDMFRTREEALRSLSDFRLEDKNVWVLGY